MGSEMCIRDSPLVHTVPQQGGDRQREFKKSSYRFVLLGENIVLNKHVATEKPQANQTNKPHVQREQIWAGFDFLNRGHM